MERMCPEPGRPFCQDAFSAQQQVHSMGRVGQNQHLLYHHVHLLALRLFLLSIPQTLTESLLSAIMTIDSYLQNRINIVA